jgi:V8-like Glu-specific endopeptidase
VSDLLPGPRLQEIEDAIITSNLDYNQIRQALLVGVDPHFRSIMPGGVGLPGGVQLTLDLGFLNGIERLANGTVPLRIWLANAARMLRTLPEPSKVLQGALDAVEHMTTGSPRIDVNQLPETQETIVHQDDMVTFTFMEMGVEAASSVAKLVVIRFDNGQKRLVNGNPMCYLGTGWLLTDSLIITNHHVVNARNEGEPAASDSDFTLQGQATVAKFDFDGENVQGTDFAAVSLEAWDKELDYAVLRLPSTGRKALARSAAAVTKTDQDYIPVNIIQHPEGTSKRYAIRNNLVTAATAADLRYFTDTKQGSSGAPVLNDRWEVVALHRGSNVAQNVKFQGKSVAWVNVGTQITAILADLKQRYAGLAGELG